VTLLKVENLNKSFGGLTVTQNVNVTLDVGQIHAIIGPNGAGKSTLFNQISGYLRPDSGRILFEGRDITGMAPHKIVKLGIGRAFQRSNIFPRLSTYENVLAAVMSYNGVGWQFWKSTRAYHEQNQRAAHILESIGLAHQSGQLAGKLALGDQKRLEIGLALALEPKLLLLDEPTAGMSTEETESTMNLVSKLVQEFKVAMLFTEHDMSVVFGVSEFIQVLYYGEVIAEGKPQDIARNPRVQEVYLGSDPTRKKSFLETL
jgi:branched-chain amino acid transport system ATP-binding protein